MSHRKHSIWQAPCVAAAIGAIAAPAAAQFDEVPEELRGIDIVEHLDDRLPLDLQFVGSQGEVVKFGDLFTGSRPVILVPNYYRCPSLCSLTLNGLVNGTSQLEWSAGAEFDVVAFSINPEEPWQLARAKRDGYAIDYVYKSRKEGMERKWKMESGKPATEKTTGQAVPDSEVKSGFEFMADHDDSARRLCEAIGFNYRLVPETGEYSHAACLVLCTPDGRISRYLYGSYYPVGDLKLALVEAGQGKVGSAFDRFLLWCHRFDKDKGYVKSALQIMKLGGLLTVLTMGVGLFFLWRMDLLHPRRLAADEECF